jgi:pilus assembly protein CpaE
MPVKIKLITPDPANAQAWAEALRAEGGHEVKALVSALREVNVVVNGSRPDLVLAETRTPQDFEALERLATSHPEIDYLLVSHAAEPDMLLRAMRAGVREVLQAPASPAAVAEALRRQVRKRPVSDAPPPKARGELIAVVSCKGGSGATFVAANLAHLLTQGGRRRVALIDLNLQFGDAALFVSDGRGISNVADVARNIERLDAALLRSSMSEVTPGLWVLAAPDDPSQGVEVTPDHVRRILELAREMHDHVVIDTGRALSPVTLQALDMADGIYPVLQLTLPFIRDGKRLRDVFQSLDYPQEKVHWIVNRHQKDSEFKIEDLQKALGLREVITLPNHYEAVASSVNQGVPVDTVAPGSSISRALRDLAKRIGPQPSPIVSKRWLAGLFRPAASARTNA